MKRRKEQALLSSSSEDDDSDMDLSQKLLSLPRRSRQSTSQNDGKGKLAEAEEDNSLTSDSESDYGDDVEWTASKKQQRSKASATGSKGKGGRGGKRTQQPRKKRKKSSAESADSEDKDIEVPEQPDDDDSNADDSTDQENSQDSSSESLFDETRFDDGWRDDLMGDEEDRARMAQLTEKEREEELYNRVEKREALRTRYAIEMKLRKARKEGKKKKKKKLASTASDRQERRRIMNRKRDKEFEKIRIRRDKRSSKRNVDTSTPIQHRHRLTTSDVFTDDDEDDGREITKSDDEFKDGSYSPLRNYDASPYPGVTYITTKAQLSYIRLSRHKLEKWVHMPFFAETVIGCFIRIGIGTHEGKQVYRVAEIIDVIESGRVYNLNNTSTNKVLRLRHGLDEHTFRMEYVSNGDYTDNEFSKWKVKMKELDLNLPNVEDVERKKRDIERARNYSFADADIDEIVAEKEKFRKNPSNFAFRQSKLEEEVKAAQFRGDKDEVEKIKDEISQLDQKAKQISMHRSQALDPIASINQRNRQKNLSDIEKALAMEVASDISCGDPFTRRKCKPILVSMAKDVQNLYKDPTKASFQPQQQDISTATEEKTDDLLARSTHTGVDSMGTSSQEQSPSSKPCDGSQVVNLFNAHDFDVKIDIDVSPAVSGLSASKKQSDNRSSSQTTSRRYLNLSDYKKRKGLI